MESSRTVTAEVLKSRLEQINKRNKFVSTASVGGIILLLAFGIGLVYFGYSQLRQKIDATTSHFTTIVDKKSKEIVALNNQLETLKLEKDALAERLRILGENDVAKLIMRVNSHEVFKNSASSRLNNLSTNITQLQNGKANASDLASLKNASDNTYVNKHEIASYYTKENVDQLISQKATPQMIDAKVAATLESYVKHSELKTQLAQKIDVATAETRFITKSDAEKFILKSEAENKFLIKVDAENKYMTKTEAGTLIKSDVTNYLKTMKVNQLEGSK